MDNERGRLDRRQFLAGVSASALLTATHAHGARAAAPGAAGRDASSRIRALRLQTAAPLAEMSRFYEGLLGLRRLSASGDELTILAGATAITFVNARPGPQGAPFYHFAFNIPENKLLAAREWQLERTALIPPYPGLRDPEYPDDVVHFASWNAHSVFFWDPAGNLLEHIARHDLANSAPGGFTSEDILYASEIAFIVDDVPAAAARVEATFGLTRYRPGSDRFTAVGDEHGLLLMMKRGRVLGFDEGRPAAVFATEATLRDAGSTSYEPPGFPYRIRSR